MSFEDGIWIGLVEFVLCFALGIVVTTVAYRFMRSALEGVDGLTSLKEGNVAVGLVYGSAILGSAYIVYSSVFPAMSVFKSALLGGDNGLGWMTAIVLMFVFSMVSLALAVVSLRLSIRTTIWLTREIDEVKMLQDGNLAAGLLLMAILLANSLFLARGLSSLLLALVPYPQTGTLQIMGAS